MNDSSIERELGTISEGIKNLNRRYGEQERRLGRVETNMASLRTAFASHPGECLVNLEEKFVTKERIKPLENTCALIKKASIYVFCAVIGSAAAVVFYIKDRL